MKRLTAEKYRELFRLRAEGELDHMECTKHLYEILKPLYFEGMKILDVGCGAGHYYRKLRELGPIDYWGVDIDEGAIEIANEVWGEDPNVAFGIRDANDLNFKDNSFDVVICYNLLLHLGGYKNALKEMFRVARKFLIVRSLYGDGEKIRTERVTNDISKSGFVYVNTFSREEVVGYVESLGNCTIEFIKENLKIPRDAIEEQAKKLDVNTSEFTASVDDKQVLKGIPMNYGVLFVEKGGVL